MFQLNKQQKRRRKLWQMIGTLIVVIIACIAVFVTVSLLVNGDPDIDNNIAPTGPADSSQNEDQLTGSIKGRFLFSGTVVTARAVENEARQADGSVDWGEVFSQFGSFNPEQYSEWFVDYECPVTTNSIPYSVQVANTVFNCEPSVFSEASKYFTVANIANNHTRDQGDEGFTQTRQNILDGDLQAVGHWDPRQVEDSCEVLSLTYTLEISDGQSAEVELPIAACAFHHFEKEPVDSDFELVEQYAEVMPVIGLMQVGAEYRAENDARQQQVARELIDRGVDFVVGNSPHWVQNTEVYSGKLIVYSTGNFIFDQLDEETNRGLSLDVTMDADYDQNMVEWIGLGEICEPEKFKDDCFQRAKDLGLQRYNFNYEFDIVASTGGYRELTSKAGLDVQLAVEERANWQETLEMLGQ